GASAGAADYEKILRQNLGESPTLDLVILGMGPDGHTASIFPRSPGNEWIEEQPVVGVPAPRVLKPEVERITLTFPMICRSRNILVTVTGKEKAPNLERALKG